MTVVTKIFNGHKKKKSDVSSGTETIKTIKIESKNFMTKIKDSERLNIATDLSHRIKKRRKSKSSFDERKYTCYICMRSYLSYPALYTHKRNKHNIIPITGKQDIFKNFKKDSAITTLPRSGPIKYNYSAVENIQENLEFVLKSIKTIYAEAAEDIYKREDSLLFVKNFDLAKLEGYKVFEKFEDKGNNIDLNVFQGQALVRRCVDDVLILYLINFFKVTGQVKELKGMVVKFVILFREYLNISGWDYKKTFIKYDVAMPLSLKGSYTQCFDCDDIPDLINNFVSVFLQIDPKGFNLNLKEFLDIVKNFLNWLFVNSLTNYKISENEPDYHGKISD